MGRISSPQKKTNAPGTIFSLLFFSFTKLAWYFRLARVDPSISGRKNSKITKKPCVFFVEWIHFFRGGKKSSVPPNFTLEDGSLPGSPTGSITHVERKENDLPPWGHGTQPLIFRGCFCWDFSIWSFRKNWGKMSRCFHEAVGPPLLGWKTQAGLKGEVLGKM